MGKNLKVVVKPLYNLLERLSGHIYPYIYPYIPKGYWDRRQHQFFNTWGWCVGRKDDHIYRAYLEKFAAKRLLDIGCGYGRLFPLYVELNIPEVVGIDISPYAISTVREKYPAYRAAVMKIEELDFPPDYFDAAISNHTLAYVPPNYINRAIDNIVRECKSVFLIEPVRGEVEFSRFLHNYDLLFKDKCTLVERYGYSPQHDVMIYSR